MTEAQRKQWKQELKDKDDAQVKEYALRRINELKAESERYRVDEPVPSDDSGTEKD